MNRLFRIYLRESLPIVALITLPIPFHIVSDGAAANFALPGGDFGYLSVSLWTIYGSVVGAVAGGWDDFRGRLDYTLHRGLTNGQLARVLCLASLAGLALALTAQLGLSAVILWLVDADVAIAGAGRWVDCFLLGSVALSTCAIGFWSARLSLHWILRICVLLMVAIGSLLLNRVLVGADGGLVGRLGFVSVQIAITVAFVALATAGRVPVRDLDRPMRGWRFVTGAIVATSLVFVTMQRTIGRFQHRAHLTVTGHYPSIVVPAEGAAPVLSSSHVDGFDGFAQVDRDHVPVRDAGTGAPIDAGPFDVLFSPWRARIAAETSAAQRAAGDKRRVVLNSGWFDAPHELVAGRIDRGGVFLDRRDGSLELIAPTEGEADRVPRRVVLGHVTPGSEPIVVGRASRVRTRGLLVDPVTETAWSVDLKALEAAGSDVADVLVRLEGEDARDARTKAAEQRQKSRTALGLAGQLDDPLEFVVEAGGVRHEYAPRTAAERSAAWRIELLALLRAPTSLVASWLSPVPDDPRWSATFDDAILFEPLVRGGKRTGLVLLGIALNLLVGAGLAWRLRSLGAERSRAWLSFGLVAGFGPAGMCIAGALEPERPWKRAPFRDEPAPVRFRSTRAPVVRDAAGAAAPVG